MLFLDKNVELQKIENFLEKNEKIKFESIEFEKIMFIYSVAIKEIKNKLEILKEEYKLFYDYDL